jgi:hypothetical protein
MSHTRSCPLRMWRRSVVPDRDGPTTKMGPLKGASVGKDG